ncbi:MAG: hypothetical protein AABZ39_04855 [Spirochaetota bacterium]
MIKNIVKRLTEIIKDQSVAEEVVKPAPKYTQVSMPVYGQDLEVKVSYLLSKVIDGLVCIPKPRLKPSNETLLKDDFDVDEYVYGAQRELEDNISMIEAEIGGSIVPSLVYSSGDFEVVVPFVKHPDFREGLQLNMERFASARFSPTTIQDIAKTMSYLGTPVFENSMTFTVEIIPAEWLTHPKVLDGCAYVFPTGKTVLHHPRGICSDNDVLQIRGLVQAESGLHIFKGIIAPITAAQLSGVIKPEFCDSVKTMLMDGKVVATSDTVKKCPAGKYQMMAFCHDCSLFHDSFSTLKQISLQMANKLVWTDTSAYEDKALQNALRFSSAFYTDAAMVDEILGSIDEIDGDEDLPVEEIRDSLSMIKRCSMSLYDKVGLPNLVKKALTMKRMKSALEWKTKGFRLFLTSSTLVPRGSIMLNANDYSLLRREFQNEMAVVARPPFQVTSINEMRVIKGDWEADYCSVHPDDLSAFNADLDGDHLLVTRSISGLRFISGFDLESVPLKVSRENLQKYCPTMKAQYSSAMKENAAILYALSVGERIDIGNNLIDALILRTEREGHLSQLEIRRACWDLEKSLLNGLISCKKKVSAETMIPNVTSIAQIVAKEKLHLPDAYRLLAGKIDFPATPISELSKDIKTVLAETTFANPIIELVRAMLLDFMPDETEYVMPRMSCQLCKALIGDIMAEYGDLVKELGFIVTDGPRGMRLENPLLDRYLEFCKSKMFSLAADYLKSTITPWVEGLKVKDDYIASMLIIGVLAFKNRAGEGRHSRFGFMFKFIPGVVLKTITEMICDRNRPIEHEMYVEYVKAERGTLSILK